MRETPEFCALKKETKKQQMLIVSKTLMKSKLLQKDDYVVNNIINHAKKDPVNRKESYYRGVAIRSRTGWVEKEETIRYIS